MPRRPSRTTSVTAGRTAARSQAPITPLKLPRHIKTLVVFGGSFDPPHHMHTQDPLFATEEMFGDKGWLLYVPAAANPLKQGPIASDEHRLAMLRYAIELPGQRSIWTDELDRAAWARARGREAAPSYTIDTLRRLRRIVPKGVTLRLLMGSDQVWKFHEWREPREIIRLAEPLLMMRSPVDCVAMLWTAAQRARFWTREELRAWLTRVTPCVATEMSSTNLRRAIRGAPDKLDAWFRREPLHPVAEGVARHIIRYNLYGHRRGKARPLDPKDMPPAPVGDYPRFIWRTRGMSDAQWARIFRRIDPKNFRSEIPAYSRPIMNDLPSKRTRSPKA